MLEVLKYLWVEKSFCGNQVAMAKEVHMTVFYAWNVHGGQAGTEDLPKLESDPLHFELQVFRCPKSNKVVVSCAHSKMQQVLMGLEDGTS